MASRRSNQPVGVPSPVNGDNAHSSVTPLRRETRLMETAAVEQFMFQFKRTANSIAARYGAPLYLVGGALHAESPRDWDLRITLQADDLERLFGADGPRMVDAQWNAQDWRRAFDGLKQSRRFSRLYARNIDFQIQTERDAAPYARDPRLRIDDAPEGFFDAGRE